MELTISQLAALVGGTVDGNGDAVVSGFATIEEAREGCLTFLANPKYTHHIYETNATAVLVNNGFIPERPVKATLIRVADPYATLAEIMGKVQSMQQRPRGIEQPCHIAEGVEIADDCYVGAYAYIGKGAVIGKGVCIYPQSYVGDGVRIGDGTVIRAGVRIYEGCVIGRRCILHSGAVIGADGFGFAPTPSGYEKIPQIGNVVLEDDTEIGANTTIDRATFGSTVIGRGTKLDNLIQIAHNVEIGHDNVMAAQTGVAGSTRIGSNNRVGGQCGFAGHITVGDNNEFGAQSGIHKDTGSDNRLIGYPAVDAGTFARNAVYMRRLDELFRKK